MAETRRAGIATFVLRAKQYLAAIRPESDVLALETMYFADEVRDPHHEIDGWSAGENVQARELTIAKQLIESMTVGWNPGNYRDTYRERVEELIRRKSRGEEVISESGPPQEAEATDLMEALRRSAEELRERRPRRAG
jgi:DNA end-binding protein Ku